MAQGYIDQVLYSRENNGLVAQCEEFRSEIETLKKSRTTDAVQTAETEKLLKFVEKAEMLEEWNEGFFPAMRRLYYSLFQKRNRLCSEMWADAQGENLRCYTDTKAFSSESRIPPEEEVSSCQ